MGLKFNQSGAHYFGCTQLQWAPTLYAHDPNPAIPLETAPFFQNGWPNPPRASRAPQHWTAPNLLETTLAPAEAAPTLVARAIVVTPLAAPSSTVAVRSQWDQRAPRLADLVVPVRGEAQQNPRASRSRVALTSQSDQRSTPLADPVRGEAQQNPRVSRSRVALTSQSDQVQPQIQQAAAPVRGEAQPVPPRATRAPQHWTAPNLLETTLAPAEAAPTLVARAIVVTPLAAPSSTVAVRSQWDQRAPQLADVVAQPFRQNEWPVPSRRRQGQDQQVLGGVIVGPDPQPAQWTTPPPPRAPRPSLSWTVNLLQTTLAPAAEQMPCRQNAWPLPGRVRKHVGELTWVVPGLALTAPAPGDPLRPIDWPNPRRGRGQPDIGWRQNLLQSTLAPGAPIQPVVIENPRVPRRRPELWSFVFAPSPGLIPATTVTPVYGWGARGGIGGTARDPWGRIGSEVAPDMNKSIGSTLANDPNNGIGSEKA